MKSSNLLLTRIVDLEFEKKCLERYEEIVFCTMKRLESTVALEADDELLNQPEDDANKAIKLSSNQYFAVVFRSE